MQLQNGNSHQQSNSIAHPLHAGHQLVRTLLWDCIPFVVSQPMWLCWLLWHEEHAQVDPYSQILEELPALWGRVQSQTHMGLSLVAESHLDISLYVDWPQWWQALFLQSGRFCRSVEDCLQFLKTHRVEKLSSCCVVFLGLCSLSLTSPARRNVTFELVMVQGLTSNNSATWFCRTPVWSTSMAWASSRSVKHGSRFQLTTVVGSISHWCW